MGYSTTVWNGNFLWHGCIFSNVVTAHTMLGQRRTLSYASHNMRVVKVQEIRLEDCLSSWYIVKNMIVCPTRFIERSKSRVGPDVNEKHLMNGTPELLPALAKKIFSKNKIKGNSVVE